MGGRRPVEGAQQRGATVEPSQWKAGRCILGPVRNPTWQSRGQPMTIDISSAHTVEVGYDEFCGALAARDLKPLWKIAKQLMPEVPLPTTQAWLWKWDDVLPLAR